MRTCLLPLLALTALSACDSGSPEPEETVDSGLAAELLPSPDPALAASPDTEIPEALRGRWGLVPADCDPGRDDAKGLLTINATTLKFYEATGTLDQIEEFDPSRIRASFNFTGEGTEWERDLVLDAQDNGTVLIRREYGEDAAPDPFRYTKCP